VTVNPMWLQAGNYEAREDRQVIAASASSEGIARGFGVTPRGLGANMSVDVAAGLCYVQGDDSPNQGMYVVENDAPMNLPISAAPASGQRWDVVCVKVNDPSAGGATGDNAEIIVVEGSPSAALPPPQPSLPPSALGIGWIIVYAGVVAINQDYINTTSFTSLPNVGVWG